MPTYEYECQKCKLIFEKFQTMTAERLKFCPKCHGRVKRLLGTGAGIIFKGSGFYTTDYRSSKYSSEAKSDGPGAAKSDGPGAAKPDSADKSKPESADKAKTAVAGKPKPDSAGKPKSGSASKD
ncbi:MAG: FmdB family zinc ribbon protein [bacterium]